MGGGSEMGGIGQAIGGMGGESNPNQAAIDAQKYKEYKDMMNSNFMSQSRGASNANMANDKAFALSEGQKAYHDQFQAPMHSSQLMNTIMNLNQTPKIQMNRGLSGFDLIQQLINRGQ